MSKKSSNSEQFHYVYKITNWYNGKEYIGKHSTYNLDDGYIGSGTLLAKSIKKYGLEYFTKEILSFHSSAQEAYKQEEIIVDEEYVKNKMTYNSITGGTGGYFPNGFSKEHCQKLSECNKGRQLSEEHKNKIKETLSGHYVAQETKNKISKALSGNTNGPHSEETKYKISLTQQGKVIVKDKNNNYFKVYLDDERYINGELKHIGVGVQRSDETKKKISKANKGKIISDETKKKMSDAQIGIKKQPRTEQHQQNLSNALKGRNISEAQKEKQRFAIKNLIYVHNLKLRKHKRIKKEELENFLALNLDWIEGFCNFKKLESLN